MQGPEKVPDWLSTGITYLPPKSGDSKEVGNYQPITCLTTKNNSQKNTFGRAELTTSRAERMSPWK